MDIKNLKFTTIENEKSSLSQNKKEFIVLYWNNIYVSSGMWRKINETCAKDVEETINESGKSKSKRFFVVASISGNILKLDFYDKKVEKSFEGFSNINISKENEIVTAWIGNKDLTRKIAENMHLDLTKTKFFPSISYQIDGQSIYFEFSKDVFRFSRKLKNESK